MPDKISPAAIAFSEQSRVFDDLDRSNPLSVHLRQIFRAEVERYLSPGSEILELNCGTGLDAFYFASLGHRVLATDAAPGMIERVNEKRERSAGARVEAMQLSYHDLAKLQGRKFDHIVSNFGGLNCTGNLAQVLELLPGLLRRGGRVTLVIMPKVCPWELMMLMKGKFRTAFRRLRKQTIAHVEGVRFNSYYYNPSFVKRRLRKSMRVLTLRGIFITVPPEFYSGFVERYPRLYRFLCKTDRLIGSVYPFNRWCDHFMITLEKKDL